MDRERLRELFERVRAGELSVEDGLGRLAALPFVALEPDGVANVRLDTHRAVRCGFPEVVFGEGKSAAELASIARTLVEHHERLLVTRVSDEGARAILADVPDARHRPRSRLVTLGEPEPEDGEGHVLVVAAGTADTAVAEEALVTARMLGARTELLADVGVAGLQRLLAHAERLREARVVVVVAGMEGALASVVGGLVDRPVIAVPTSIGYGAGFGGLAALLSMMSSCAAGVSCVNIDNGFGGGYAAAQINSACLALTPGTRSGSMPGRSGEATDAPGTTR